MTGRMKSAESRNSRFGTMGCVSTSQSGPAELDIAADTGNHGQLHYVELWVPDLNRAMGSWGWLLSELGYELFQQWRSGRSWRRGTTTSFWSSRPR